MSKLNSQSPDPDAFVNSISDINPNFENQISLVSQKIDDNPKLKNLYMRLEQYKEKYKQAINSKKEIPNFSYQKNLYENLEKCMTEICYIESKDIFEQKLEKIKEMEELLSIKLKQDEKFVKMFEEKGENLPDGGMTVKEAIKRNNITAFDINNHYRLFENYSNFLKF